MNKNKVIIANGSGFWGDSNLAPVRLVKEGPIDYLTFDYLAETTMSILARQMQKDPSMGYARDFITVMDTILEDIVSKNIKVISNAGGINPFGARDKILQLASEKGIKDLKIAVIHGDNILPDLSNLSKKTALANMENNESFKDVQDKVLSANVYIGAGALVKALEQGAQIIITGRATDTSLTLAPLIYEFGWDWQDWDKLATGIVAGHILECGAQSTGGNFTDWPLVPNFGKIGYPVCEIFSDGSFVVTKHPNTGGMVSVATVSEQLVYEMGNPKTYLTPDVTADFTTIHLKQEDVDRVHVSGIKGFAPPEKLKVSIAYQDGYKAFSQFTMAGFDLENKADTAIAAIKDRIKELNIDLEEFYTEYIGLNSSFGPSDYPTNPKPAEPPREIVVRIGVKDHDRGKIDLYSKEIAPLLTSGPTGITGFAAGRSAAAPVIVYWPALIERDLVEAKCDINGQSFSIKDNYDHYLNIDELSSKQAPSLVWPANENMVTVPLLLLAYARSGDKGEASNVGIVARNPEIYPYLVAELSAEKVKKYFHGIVKGSVIRYEVPNIYALNFILGDSLGGGGASSLKNDAQGKIHGQVMLYYPVTLPRDLIPDSIWKEKYLTN